MTDTWTNHKFIKMLVAVLNVSVKVVSVVYFDIHFIDIHVSFVICSVSAKQKPNKTAYHGCQSG
jgi:hypothetical protein